MATLEAALRDFYNEYEYDARGYAHLWLELRAYVCGARVGEAVVGSGGIATAISSYVGRGLSGAVESVSDNMYDVCNASLYKYSIVPASNDIREPKNMHGECRVAH